MAFSLDSITKKISDVGQGMTQKGKNFVDTQKLNSQINDLTKSINDSFLELGTSYYENNKENPSEADAAIFSSITQAQAQIEDLKAQIRAIKGISICSNCGAEVPSSQKFCSNCGTPVEAAPAPAPAQAAGKVCPNCGAPVDEGTKFCATCGTPIQ